MLHAFTAIIIWFESGESFFDKYINQPGFEVWKFLNLFLFIGVMVYILRRPLSNALAARRELIRAELLKAQQERDAAQAKLQEVEERLSRLNGEVEQLKTRAQSEAQAERERLARATEEEINKLREQAQREIQTAARAAQQDLRRYAAEQSVKLAEELIRQDINPEQDAQLATQYVSALGGLKR